MKLQPWLVQELQSPHRICHCYAVARQTASPWDEAKERTFMCFRYDARSGGSPSRMANR